MATPTKATKYTLPFKKIRGKANTSNSKPVFSESISSQVSIDIGKVLGQKIPADPQQSVDNGIAEYVELDLSPITGSNGLSYNLQFKDEYDKSFGTGVQGENVRNHTQVVDKTNNLSGKVKPDHSGGYGYKLEDKNGNRIPSGSRENWILDPVASILTSEKQISELSNGGTLSCYIYTGKMLDEVLVQNSIDIKKNGQDIASVSVLNFSSGLDISMSGDTATIVAGFDNVTTDSISEGENNLYYTDTRVDTRVNEIRPTGRKKFSGNGVKRQFSIAHGLGSVPSSWVITPTTDDASSYSHVEADDTNLYINYDTPPPVGTDNIVINWMVSTF